MAGADWHLVDQAFEDLLEIEQWAAASSGKDATAACMADIYSCIDQIACDPTRQTAPWFYQPHTLQIAAARDHFILYCILPDDSTVILAIEHQDRQTESLITEMGETLLAEIRSIVGG